MTAPTFDLIPVPSRNALANPPPPAGSQATTIDANFAKVNPWLSAKSQASAWESRLTTSVQFPSNPYWAGMSGWPAVWFTMPDCQYVIITMSALLDQVPTTALARLGIVCVNFPGLPSNVPSFSNDAYALEAGGLWSSGLTGVLNRSYINPGAQVGVLPAYFIDSGAVWIAFGLLTVTAVA